MPVTRRSFLQFLFYSFTFLSTGCSDDKAREIEDFDINAVVAEKTFSSFLNVIFPFHLPGFRNFSHELHKRLKRLKKHETEVIINAYQLFKEKYVPFGEESVSKGEKILSRLLKDKTTEEQTNRALDIIYDNISKLRGFGHSLWGREYSKAGEMCQYWESYDKAP